MSVDEFLKWFPPGAMILCLYFIKEALDEYKKFKNNTEKRITDQEKEFDKSVMKIHDDLLSIKESITTSNEKTRYDISRIKDSVQIIQEKLLHIQNEF
jgi:hypothetical protein